MIGGSPETLRSRAQDLRRLAEAVTSSQSRMATAISDADWRSDAASAFREEAARCASSLSGVAQEFCNAASALDNLASTLESRQQALRHLAAATGKTVEELYREAVSTGQNVLDYASGIARAVGRDESATLKAASQLTKGGPW